MARLDGGREPLPLDFKPHVRPVQRVDPGTDPFDIVASPADQRVAEVALLEPRVPLDGKVHREAGGEKDITEHVTAVPGVPAVRESRLDGPVLLDVRQVRVVLGEAVGPCARSGGGPDGAVGSAGWAGVGTGGHTQPREDGKERGDGRC